MVHSDGKPCTSFGQSVSLTKCTKAHFAHYDTQWHCIASSCIHHYHSYRSCNVSSFSYSMSWEYDVNAMCKRLNQIKSHRQKWKFNKSNNNNKQTEKRKKKTKNKKWKKDIFTVHMHGDHIYCVSALVCFRNWLWFHRSTSHHHHHPPLRMTVSVSFRQCNDEFTWNIHEILLFLYAIAITGRECDNSQIPLLLLQYIVVFFLCIFDVVVVVVCFDFSSVKHMSAHC